MENTKSPPPSTAQLFQVFLRLRPSSPQSSVSETRFLTAAPGQNFVYVTPPQERSRFRAIERFGFTRIFDELSEQKDVFVETVMPLLQQAINGRDGTLATLGVTGSGKTHTILGSKDQKGMTQMALDVLFSSIGDRMVDHNRVDIIASDHTEAILMDAVTFHERMNSALVKTPTARFQDRHTSKRSSLAHISTPKAPDVGDLWVDLDSKSKYAVLISMYELYNDRIFDLLDDSIVNNQNRRKALIFKKPSTTAAWDTSKESKKVVSGLRKVYAKNFQEALQILEHGQASRRASPTHSNSVSSRSHAFLQVEVKRFSPRGNEKGGASLHIVDLAGSERARTAKTAGERLAEAGSINRSLMCLGQCLQLQTQVSDNGKPAVVPWRQSKLTELLFSNSFSGAGGGGQRASMIVTADAMGDFNATTQILRYSALAREVTVPRASSRQISGMSDSSAASSTLEELAVISTSTTQDDSKDALIARLIAQLEETEARWRDAEERCLTIEQQVREEVADEMEERLEEWREGYVDGKLEILRKGIEIREDTPPDAAERIQELESDNEALRRELLALRREALGRSPSKGRSGGRGFPSPLKGMENLEIY
ncbi:P-loop containing nucleoside triphosphate hydrolase protein [Tuber magnatum]|uniref:Kinesin-like protein n=1 Tax=Tuber magnatum TaxID=42249 RepID=A0A317SP32_9PEZI|nr:P-loop containing nucleoside triphosphate hydrolase protein [Tuber magnatum]